MTRTLLDLLMSPATTITGDVRATGPLLRGFSAVVHGFAHLPRSGAARGCPVELRGFCSEVKLVGDEAARAVRILARATAEPATRVR
ncbi:hypothetical protein [Kineococcus indalonis]|uniref:hypothetical protein n=1 Tax=Kineococcus indalonis TaxID=2696566 RepID=UPI0014135EA8|nr:hypothetical protein [Kineococcus indalonis]NAZ85721.1 hypothetical protein [Kineococcus indalonis]